MFTSSQIFKHLKPAQKDFVILCTVAIIALVIAVHFDAFDRFAHWYVKQREPWEVEEALVAIFVLSFCFAIFSYRRWKELILEVQEREKIEKALKEQTESLNTLMDTIPNPIFYTDVDGRYTGCNKTFEDSNGSVSVFEVSVPVGQKLMAPAHKNDAYEEILYGIKGVLTWTVDGTLIEVGPGQALCIPRGAVHRFDNLGAEDVKQLAIITPAIMGPAYFREAAEVIGAAAGNPPDRAKIVEVFRRHGMTVAEPEPFK